MNTRRLLLLAYTCSGFAGLVYQITWTRLLVLHVGSTTGAITTVVAAFMGGLAAGAAAAAGVALRYNPRRALKAYAALEAGAATAALLLPLALAAFEPLLAWTYQSDGTGIAFTIVRTLVCLTAVAVPCVLLGATFPMAMRGASQDGGAPSRHGGQLYAVNTAGAACGSLAAGFFLLPLLGLRQTTLVGAAASLLAAGAAMFARSRVPAGESSEREAQAAAQARRKSPVADANENDTDATSDAADMLGAIFIVATTGFAGLLYEVAWTRASASLLGPTTYAFSGVVFILIAGLAIGSAIGASRWLRVARPHTTLGATLAATAFAVWAGNLALGTRIPRMLAYAFAGAKSAPGWPLLLRMAATLGPLVPAAVGLGVAFPVALRLAGSRATADRRIGFLYAVNTAAGVAGTFLAAPLLLAFGLEGCLRLVPACIAAAAGVSIALGSRFRELAPTLATATLFGLAVYVPIAPSAWDRELLASGVYKYARTIPPGADLESVLKAATLVDYRDGEHATVAVTEFAGTTSLVVDGKVDGSTGGDMLTQALVAHLPLLLHERPRDVLVIGLGTGVTLAAAATHPAERIDVVEISPEIVRASGYFREQNRNALSDPRVHLIVGDGRSQLGLGNRKYDVIISEPSNPWVAGMAALFTRETFASIRASLAPGGTVCQWVHTYDIAEGDLRSIVATFASVFPNATIWMVGDGDLLLSASADRMDDRLANIATSWNRPGVAADLRRVGVTGPFGLLSMWAGGPQAVAALGAGAPLQSDDRMALEFSGPLAVYRTTGSNQVLLMRRLRDTANAPPVVQQAREHASASDWRDRGAMLQKIHVFDEAYASYTRAFDMDPGDASTISSMAAVSIQAGTTDDAIDRLRVRLKTAPSAAGVRVALSKLLASTGGRAAAIAAVQTPDDEDASAPLLEQLAAMYADSGDLLNLERTVEKLQELRPGAPRTRYLAGSARFLQGAFADALTQAKLSLDGDPKDPDALNLAGGALASLGRFDEAQQAFEAALMHAPSDPTIFVNLGMVAMSKGDAARAEKDFAAAVTLAPSFEPARQGLARAREAERK